MRRCDDTRGGAHRLAADRRDHLLLQSPEDLCLHRKRHVADLIEKQRSILGIPERARAVAGRSRERALHMAEQLAFEQVRGDGGAVDRNERALFAPAVIV